MPQPEVWALLAEILKASGAYANVDVGGAGATSQEELHQCLQDADSRTDAGSMHTRVNTRWDLATAIKLPRARSRIQRASTPSRLSNGHEGTQQIYDVVVATL